MSDKSFKEKALAYHSLPRPGKIETVATKPLVTQEDLSLGYTPGVAHVCEAIAEDPTQANGLTSKANLVAVVTNGSAVLGLGNIGPLAAKPVMEGKGILFKQFANIDVFDLEINENDPDKLVDIIASLAPTFGGINLEDIKAPECFEIEKKLRERLDIPVLHDDQHGTAIIVTAAFINSLHLTGKKKDKVKIACAGAGAAGLACMNMLVDYGVPRENITLIDKEGVIHADRKELNEHTQPFASKTKDRTLADAVKEADYFFGLSAGGILKPEMVKSMAKQPVIFAMANPTPEIMPDIAKAARPDVIIGTGRSDFPNQINNVLGFPYLFRGALDCGAMDFNMAMKLAAAEALAMLARKEADASLEKAYKGRTLKFGEDYLIPKPFDSRLLHTIAPAVAKAAMESGVAANPIKDLKGYAHSLQGANDQSFNIMRRIFNSAAKDPRRIVFPEGEDMRVLKAVQTLVNEGIAKPILLGRTPFVEPLLQEAGLSMQPGKDFELIDPTTDPRVHEYAKAYYDIRKRQGVLPPEAVITLRGKWATFAAMMVKLGDADAMVAGVTGRFHKFLRVITPIIGKEKDAKGIYALQLVMQGGKVYFIGDTHVNTNPTPEQVAELTYRAHHVVKQFGIDPRIALISHSNFGSAHDESAKNMREAFKLVRDQWPDLMVEGEMQTDAALNMEVLQRVFPESTLKEPANVLIMPNVESANIAFNLLRSVQSDGEYIGPIMLGLEKPVHILSVDAPVRRIVHMAALAVVEAQQGKNGETVVDIKKPKKKART